MSGEASVKAPAAAPPFSSSLQSDLDQHLRDMYLALAPRGVQPLSLAALTEALSKRQELLARIEKANSESHAAGEKAKSKSVASEDSSSASSSSSSSSSSSVLTPPCHASTLLLNLISQREMDPAPLLRALWEYESTYEPDQWKQACQEAPAFVPSLLQQAYQNGYVETVRALTGWNAWRINLQEENKYAMMQDCMRMGGEESSLQCLKLLWDALYEGGADDAGAAEAEAEAEAGATSSLPAPVSDDEDAESDPPAERISRLLMECIEWGRPSHASFFLDKLDAVQITQAERISIVQEALLAPFANIPENFRQVARQRLGIQ